MTHVVIRARWLSIGVVLCALLAVAAACRPLTQPYPPPRSDPPDTGITATVTDRSTGRWVEGAIVEIVEGPDRGRACTTRRNGSCFLGNLVEGWHGVSVRRPGYVAVTERRSTDDPAWTFDLSPVR